MAAGLEGPELELQAAAKVGDQIPVELFGRSRETSTGKVETRVDVPTPAPTTGTGVNLDPNPSGMIYARSVIASPWHRDAFGWKRNLQHGNRNTTGLTRCEALAKGADAMMRRAAALTPADHGFTA